MDANLDAQSLADTIDGEVWRFSNGQLAAAGSTLASELFESGSHVVHIYWPGNEAVVTK